MRLLLLLLVAICVFDPADLMLGGKVWVFALLWLVTVLRLAASSDEVRVSRWLLEYVLAFIAIPTLSVIWYYIYSGQQPFDGLAFLKGYLLVSLALVLRFNRIDLVPMLSAVLTLLAVAVIVVFAAIMIDPNIYDRWKPAGIASGLFFLDWRSYGKLTMLQAFFVTSPMLVIPIAYYFDRAMTSNRKPVFLTLCAVCIVGMAAAGTRNNIFIALLLPALLWPQYTARPLYYTAFSLGALALLTLPFLGQIRALLDPAETANTIRIGLVNDYIRILSEPSTLLFGRGLGAYETWGARAQPNFSSVSELTFFEIIRNFGIIGGAAMIGLLFMPATSPLLRKSDAKERSLAIAYLLYLVMSFSNPILFNSMGILILATLLARRPVPTASRRSELTFRQVAPGV